MHKVSIIHYLFWNPRIKIGRKPLWLWLREHSTALYGLLFVKADLN